MAPSRLIGVPASRAVPAELRRAACQLETWAPGLAGNGKVAAVLRVVGATRDANLIFHPLFPSGPWGCAR